MEHLECQKPFWNQNPRYFLKMRLMLEKFVSKYGNVVMFRSWGGQVNVFINDTRDISHVLSANTPIERYGKDPLAKAQFLDLLGNPSRFIAAHMPRRPSQ
jgi:hypothetical protein